MSYRYLVGIFALCLPYTALSQITFDGSSSSWGAGNSFSDFGSPGAWRTDVSPDGTTAYASGSSDGTYFTFGFANTTPSATADFDLSSTDLSAGTTLSLVFTGLSAAPNYVAITGGSITAYSYNSGTLTLTASTVNPVASASDTTGATLGSAFGLILDYGSSNNLSGTVFQTNMYWGDMDGVVEGYAGDSPLAGLNADGFNGVEASFVAHLPLPFLQANGINSPADCIALVQKVGSSFTLGISRELHADSNLFDDVGYTYAGASVFDLNGGGIDNYIEATYSNASWSDGNIGITAVPEASAYALLLGALSLAGTTQRRRRRA